MKTVVLLSGGIDSTVLLTEMVTRGHHCLAITFNYGQTHQREIDASRKIADTIGTPWQLVSFLLGGSALTGHGDIPDGHAEHVDATYVPGRNLVMIAIAASIAEQNQSCAVLIGANKDDAAGYPDCRPKFITAIDQAVSLATARGISVTAPYLNKTKTEIVAHGVQLGAPLNLTWSCYRGGEVACGRCGACEARQEAMP